MPTPLDALHDILPPPRLPWEPGTVMWLAVLASGFVVLLAIVGSRRLQRRYNAPPRWRLVHKQVLALEGRMRAVEGTELARIMDQLSKVIRRVLNEEYNDGADALGPAELTKRAESASDPVERELLQMVATLDNQRYAPGALDLNWCKEKAVRAREQIERFIARAKEMKR